MYQTTMENKLRGLLSRIDRAANYGAVFFGPSLNEDSSDHFRHLKLAESELKAFFGRNRDIRQSGGTENTVWGLTLGEIGRFESKTVMSGSGPFNDPVQFCYLEYKSSDVIITLYDHGAENMWGEEGVISLGVEYTGFENIRRKLMSYKRAFDLVDFERNVKGVFDKAYSVKVETERRKLEEDAARRRQNLLTREQEGTPMLM
jgi:hypothetical protein